MINVILSKDNSSNIYKVKANGHSDRRPEGEEDAICAAVSVLLINTFNALKELNGSDVKLDKVEDGFLSFEITSKMSSGDILLMNTLELGLKSINEPEALQITYE